MYTRKIVFIVCDMLRCMHTSWCRVYCIENFTIFVWSEIDMCTCLPELHSVNMCISSRIHSEYNSSFLVLLSPQMPTYKFHVHSGRIGVRSSLKSICDEMFTGPHYNPFNVTIDLAYHAKCSPLQPRRCELGDTAGKVGLLQNLSAPQQKIDPMLPLQGPNSGEGRCTF